MENLRKVKFTLEGQVDMGLSDYDNDEEREEITKERDGFFHAWGKEIIPDNDRSIEQEVGIVEEVETGKIYHVIPKRIVFVE